MRIFDFKCMKCNHIFEEYVDNHDSAPEVCPSCKQTDPQMFTKKLSASSFKLNGDGFYKQGFSGK